MTGALADALFSAERAADLPVASDLSSRWTFTEIAPASFRWIGDVLEPDGTTWRLETEYRVTRAA